MFCSRVFDGRIQRKRIILHEKIKTYHFLRSTFKIVFDDSNR